MATQYPRVFTTLIVRLLPLTAALLAIGCVGGEAVPDEHRDALGAEEWAESESEDSAEESQDLEIDGESSNTQGEGQPTSSVGTEQTTGVQEPAESKEESPFLCQPALCPACRMDRQQPCCTEEEDEGGCGLLFVMCL